jgi:hypothetical protein
LNELEYKDKKRTLQTKVIVGKGKGQFFVESDITVSPPSPPIFKIEDVDVKVDVFDTKVITGGDCKWGWAKVIFNAWVCKNVVYKTVEHIHDGIVNGPLYHVTFKVPVGGFVEVEAVKGEKIKEGDIVEVVKAKFEGAKEEPHDEMYIGCDKIKVFKKLLEKMVVEIEFKVVRIEHVCIKAECPMMQDPILEEEPDTLLPE